MGSNKLVNRLDLLVGGLSLCTHKHKFITTATHTIKCHMMAAGTGLYIPQKQSSNKTDLKKQLHTAQSLINTHNFPDTTFHAINITPISKVCTTDM
jgi:hypothetical protein